MSTPRILVAVGIGPESEHAISQAHELARSTGGELLVCHAIPNALGGYPFFYRQAQTFEADAVETRRRLLVELSAYVELLTGRSSGEFRVAVHQGRTHEVILDLAQSWSATLVVVAGAVGHDERATDPDVRSILRHASIPVRIARPRSSTRRIVVGTDFSDQALPAVAAAAAESKRTGGEVTIVHSIELTRITPVWSAMGPLAFDVPSEVLADLRGDIEKRLDEALKQTGITGRRTVTDGSPVRALLDTAKSVDADLVVVGTLGRTGLPRMLVGSVAEEVALHATCSVLVVRLAHG
jgi:nucleotide-binding universal stress UspA family protein